MKFSYHPLIDALRLGRMALVFIRVRELGLRVGLKLNFYKVSLCGAVLFWATACVAQEPITPLKAKTYTSIYWSDADSGRLGDLKFRIANKDAPETGSLKQRGGAKCEAERALGYDAKAYMVGFTKGKEIRIARDYGEDRYGRLVVDLTADGQDVGDAGEAAGHLRDWPHKKGRALAPKPDWCAP